MARGFAEDEVPRRPTRRADSRRSGARPENDNFGYSNSAAYSHQQRDGGDGSIRRQRSPQRASAYAGGHYAESPILMPSGSERTLAIVPRMPHVTDSHAPPIPQSRPHRMHRRTASEAELASKSSRRGGPAHGNPSSSPVRAAGSSATLPHPRERSSLQNGSRLSGSTRPLQPPGSSKTISMVTRSRSLTSRPAGVAVYHPNNGAPNVHTTEIFPIQHRPGTR